MANKHRLNSKMIFMLPCVKSNMSFGPNKRCCAFIIKKKCYGRVQAIVYVRANPCCFSLQNLSTFTVNKTMRIYTQVSQHNVFIFSVFRRDVRGEIWIIINGWLTQKFDDNVNFYCCLALSNKQFRMEKVISKTIFRAYRNVKRVAFQYRCPGNFTLTNHSIIAATVVWSRIITSRGEAEIYEIEHAMCSNDMDTYHALATSLVPEQNTLRKPVAPKALKKPQVDFSFGVCAKLAYGNLNENLTTEWMEYHRLVVILFYIFVFCLLISFIDL